MIETTLKVAIPQGLEALMGRVEAFYDPSRELVYELVDRETLESETQNSKENTEKNHKGIWLYGESLARIFFLEKVPWYYEMASSMTSEEFLECFKIHYKNFKRDSKEDTLWFYEQDGVLHVLSNKEAPFYPANCSMVLEVQFSQDKEAFLVERKKAPLSIDRLVWDRETLYHKEFLEKELKEQSLSLSKEAKESVENSMALLIRLCRYEWLLGCSFSEELRLASGTVHYDDLFRKEFLQIFRMEKPSGIIGLLRRRGILQSFFPELLEGYQMEQNEYHAYDVYHHGLFSCDAVNEKNLLLRLSALLHDIGKPRSKREVYKKDQAKDSIQITGSKLEGHRVFYDHENIGARMVYYILRRFGFADRHVKKVAKLVRQHMFHYTREWTDTAVRRFIRKAGEDIGNLFILRYADRVGSGKKKGESRAIENLKRRIEEIRKKDQELTVLHLDIDGHALMEHLDLKPGPALGRILRYLLEQVKEDPIQNRKEILLSQAQKYLEKHPLLGSFIDKKIKKQTKEQTGKSARF